MAVFVAGGARRARCAVAWSVSTRRGYRSGAEELPLDRARRLIACVAVLCYNLERSGPAAP